MTICWLEETSRNVWLDEIKIFELKHETSEMQNYRQVRVDQSLYPLRIEKYLVSKQICSKVAIVIILRSIFFNFENILFLVAE